MPIQRVIGGYKWGDHGKIYSDRRDAEAQAAAAYMNGYKEPSKSKSKKGKKK